MVKFRLSDGTLFCVPGPIESWRKKWGKALKKNKPLEIPRRDAVVILNPNQVTYLSDD